MLILYQIKKMYHIINKNDIMTSVTSTINSKPQKHGIVEVFKNIISETRAKF